ncbi:hypothetical protein EH183_42230 [Streptomyces sp. CB01881]|uniref:hypothetical protein n=1 Tax=Streptomyces sp. CB01881 TaxID=2078691 RepID=UPI0011DF8FC7|nr:hypothetical protein [Streptomyces sp. CB01881]TYC66607.1 hypothetical protein EH183_42230 [Streptomyces sp. CB01881]
MNSGAGNSGTMNSGAGNDIGGGFGGTVIRAGVVHLAKLQARPFGLAPRSVLVGREQQLAEPAGGQEPFAVVFSCIDSRVLTR